MAQRYHGERLPKYTAISAGLMPTLSESSINISTEYGEEDGVGGEGEVKLSH